jgi:hypothetical protein
MYTRAPSQEDDSFPRMKKRGEPEVAAPIFRSGPVAGVDDFFCPLKARHNVNYPNLPVM